MWIIGDDLILEINAMRTLIPLAILGCFIMNSKSRADDCALGQRYLLLAHDHVAAYENDAALALLHQSIDACPSYEAYEQLGELAAQSSQREDKQQAVSAFVSAYGFASTSLLRARSLYQYAVLLNQEGDPENAYPLIQKAHSLDPANSDINQLADKITLQVQHPTREHIVRALKYSLYQPINDSAPAQAASKGSASTKYQTPAGGSGPSLNIPINFDTASVIVDQETRPNIAILAHALADTSMEGRNFLFIGHSDARGGDQFNVELSRQRAEALSQSVVTIEPTLNGRIKVEGHGAREPIDTGSDARALRANRRLQVLVD
jgi:outer membrane protein OmpA-like peptidoglycan-associated protein